MQLIYDPKRAKAVENNTKIDVLFLESLKKYVLPGK